MPFPFLFEEKLKNDNSSNFTNHLILNIVLNIILMCEVKRAVGSAQVTSIIFFGLPGDVNTEWWHTSAQIITL